MLATAQCPNAKSRANCGTDMPNVSGLAASRAAAGAKPAAKRPWRIECSALQPVLP